MVENSLIAQWFFIQAIIQLPNDHLICDHLNIEILVGYLNSDLNYEL